MSTAGLVVVADLSSWEAMVHLGGALRSRGFAVVRLTGRNLSRAQKIRLGIERPVFSKTLSDLEVDGAGRVDTRPLLSWLAKATDVQTVDAVGAELALHPAWQSMAHLRRAHVPGVTDADLYDKWVYSQIAERAGVPVPRSRLLNEHDHIDNRWVLKGRVGSGGDRVAMIQSENDLSAALARWSVGRDQVFLQEPVVGAAWNVGGVADRGRLLAANSYQPRSALTDPEGPSVEIRLAARPDQIEAARLFLTATGYSGPFAMDFIDDGERPYLIDFNPRFFGPWATLQAAGVDLLGAYLATLSGRNWNADSVQIETPWLPTSTTGGGGLSAWKTSRRMAKHLRPVVGRRAASVVAFEGLVEAVSRR